MTYAAVATASSAFVTTCVWATQRVLRAPSYGPPDTVWVSFRPGPKMDRLAEAIQPQPQRVPELPSPTLFWLGLALVIAVLLRSPRPCRCTRHRGRALSKRR